LRKVEVIGRVEAFFREWKAKTPATDVDLRGGKWDYKSLAGPEPRKVKLRQIRWGGFRVAMVVTESSSVCEVRCLQVYQKGDQKAAIRRAVNIAKAL
jgi:hypothetical protein